ncbi:MAG TPA: hypothetical protein ENI95_11075 [Chloroflexi bacterium]|nr:hypothetical protein [Chloroflexota bacterium]
MYTDNELLFPNYVIPVLRDMRGEEWRQLVDRVLDLPADHPEVLAFVLMMIRLDGCMECETDSYRAMRGCALCATQALRRFKGADEELLDAYARALGDVKAFLSAAEDADQQVA